MKDWSEYEVWLSKVEFLAINEDRFHEFPNEWEDKFKGWYNSGHKPEEIIDNLDFFLNPSHP